MQLNHKEPLPLLTETRSCIDHSMQSVTYGQQMARQLARAVLASSTCLSLIESFSPDGVICAFDKGKPQVRIDMLPQYKAQRPPMDPALHAQFPIVMSCSRRLMFLSASLKAGRATVSWAPLPAAVRQRKSGCCLHGRPRYVTALHRNVKIVSGCEGRL